MSFSALQAGHEMKQNCQGFGCPCFFLFLWRDVSIQTTSLNCESLLRTTDVLEAVGISVVKQSGIKTRFLLYEITYRVYLIEKEIHDWHQGFK